MEWKKVVIYEVAAFFFGETMEIKINKGATRSWLKRAGTNEIQANGKERKNQLENW